MRTTTKRKLWGRGQTVSALRCAIQELEKALATDTEARNEAIGRALTDLKHAAEGLEIYKVDRRRLRTAIERERSHLVTLLEQATAIPITIQEKVLAKVARKKKEPVKEAIKHATAKSGAASHRQDGKRAPKHLRRNR